MKKLVSYLAVFGIGFIVCAGTLKALYGLEPSSLLPGSDARSKQAVLASLNTTPAMVRHTAGDNVIVQAAAKLEPAIVDVHTVGKAIQTGGGMGDDPFFRQFFGGGGGGETVRPKGAGSGVIISTDGYILTNNHVVADTEEVTVKVGEKGYTAKVVGTDPMTDIAVVKIDPKGVKLPVAELGNSDDMRIGDWAIAIGNPLDVGTTVTLGIVSALNRTGLSAEGHSLNSVIQTDAAINPGNSGGALANINGQVVGINEAIASPSGGSVGIGFAIPINSAKKIAAQLIENGKIIRPYLGIAYAPVKNLPDQARQQLGISVKGDEGVVVSQVFQDSPADKAGLQTYDVILEANRQKISDVDGLNSIIQGLKVGDNLTLLVSRNGHNQLISVTLRERPSDFDSSTLQPRQQRQMSPFGQSGPGGMPGLP